ncbi:MAG: hypothetical protein MRJ65_10160 [Candidatus Brocadiaceae bacterium]|nr:hypothetical protein [Candidatus Brocadiaceae bacterium]
MKSFLVDIPVALIFFARPNVLKETFFSIKRARPSKLFLIQDGARSGRVDDLENIRLCRDIVKDIDWDCEVCTNYSEVNLGCGMRVYSGISWAFESVDRLVIIEDDCKACDSFFKFCEDVLEKYKDDERMDMISGMNHLGIYNKTPYSYIFAKTGSIWGWATWKRVWDTVEYDTDFINDKDAIRLLENSIIPKGKAKQFIKNGISNYKILKSGGKLTSWSHQRGLNMYLHSGLIIVPHKNLTTNIGLTADSTHAVNSIKKLPKAMQRVFFMKTYKLNFPLKHPKYIVEDVQFNREIDKIMNPNKFIKLLMRIEGLIRRIIFS